MTADYIFQGVPFAIDSNGIFRSVDEVPSGLLCGCRCAECDTPVVARKGDVRVHHFAHKDRRDCWNALESALWGMLIRILLEKDTVIRLPPSGSKRELFPDPPRFFAPDESDLFYAEKWLIAEESISAISCKVRAPKLSESKDSCADVVINDVYVCFLHSRRPLEKVSVPIGLNSRVLAIDLGVYARRWIDTCSPRNEGIQEALNAIESLRSWVAEEVTGKLWLHNPHEIRRISEINDHAIATKSERDKKWQKIEEDRLAELARKQRANQASYEGFLVRSNANRKARLGRAETLFNSATLPPPPPSIKMDDLFISEESSHCPICGSPQWLMVAGSGPYSGSRIIRCSKYPSHPTKIVEVKHRDISKNTGDLPSNG